MRDKGTGHVASKPRSDGRWPASYLHEGKRHYVYGKTKSQARARIDEILAERELTK